MVKYFKVMDLEVNFQILNILKLAIDQTPVPYFITDENGKIIYTNDALSKQSGYTKGEMLGKTPSIFKSGKHNSEFYKKMWETIKEGKFYASRIINKRKDGYFYHIFLNIQPIRIDGKVSYFLAREESIDNLIELENKLIETQKLESIAMMVGELAHDFNNFLTVIIGSLELIKDEVKKGSIYEQLTNEILKSAKNQANTIKQLLIFARKNTPEKKEVNINGLLLEIKPLIQSQITSQNKLIYELSDDIKKVNIDEQLMKQAIFNITANAKDAIENNGTVIIKTYNYNCFTEYMEPYHIGDYVVIEILDNGSGIDEKILPYIFQPFFTTKPKGKGTGLGLSSVYGIVKNHDGYVYASNRKDGNGASFRIYLPVVM